MKVYRVGGCVRDRLLGLPVNDIDWVVTGATAEQMQAAGYKPIGKDFPVFLHPESKQEYALARSERKTGPGYKGFEISADPATANLSSRRTAIRLPGRLGDFALPSRALDPGMVHKGNIRVEDDASPS